MLLFDPTPAVTAGTDAAATAASGAGFFSLFQIFIGIYLLWAGVRGKGKIFENNSVKKDKAEGYVKGMRILTFIVGPIMLIPGVLEFLGISTVIDVFGVKLSFILWLVGLIAIVGLVVYTIVFTDRTGKGVPVGGAEKKAAAQSYDEIKKARLRAAFEFDENDEEDTNKDG